MNGPVASILPDRQRLHLQHGPIDLVIGADGDDRKRAFAAAQARFETILQELVDELPLLRNVPGSDVPQGDVARRMYRAVLPHSRTEFATTMAAVAGAVADEVLAAMCGNADLDRAYVNNGGDIAIYLSPGNAFRLAIAGLDHRDLGRIQVNSDDNIRGIATSGRGGRSLSMGIADSVTVLAATGAAADVAATLIANAVDLPDHPAVQRTPANQVDPDSDLGGRLVVTDCGSLSSGDVATALNRGADIARRMKIARLISGAALFLQGRQCLIGVPTDHSSRKLVEYA